MILIKILFLLLAYLLGSIPFGMIFSKIKGINIRDVGSGNIGTANVGRALGKKFAILTFFLDMLKGALFVFLFRYSIIPQDYMILSPALYGFVAMIGHSFSVFLKFKGGKAVATGSGFVFAYIPITIPITVLIFFIVLKTIKIISVASLSCTFASLVLAIIFYIIKVDFVTGFAVDVYFVLFAFLANVMIFLLHSSNIKRLIAGTEKKYSMKR